MEARSDEELMLAHARGDAAAFREIFQRYAPTLLRLLLRHAGRPADAQDLVQQTFLQLHRARKDFREGARLRPWIVTIALNLARDLNRRRGRRPETAVEDETLHQIAVAEAPAERDAGLERRVREALARLPADQREVIELHWFEDLPFQEIATICGASAGAVRVRAHRGYVTLRKALGADAPQKMMKDVIG
jgi:RNA polymerase sigma factor (sigma-70 family)